VRPLFRAADISKRQDAVEVGSLTTVKFTTEGF
jgi:hypothetical protein